jgi:hypothetical protein
MSAKCHKQTFTDLAGHETERASRPTPGQSPVDHQSRNREGARPQRAFIIPAACRRAAVSARRIAAGIAKLPDLLLGVESRGHA